MLYIKLVVFVFFVFGQAIAFCESDSAKRNEISRIERLKTALNKAVEFEFNFNLHFTRCQIKSFGRIEDVDFTNCEYLEDDLENALANTKDSATFFVDSVKTHLLGASNQGEVQAAYEMLQSDLGDMRAVQSAYTQTFLREFANYQTQWGNKIAADFAAELREFGKLKFKEKLTYMRKNKSLFLIPLSFSDEWKQVEPNQNTDTEHEWMSRVFQSFSSESSHTPVVHFSGHTSHGARKYSGVCGESTMNGKSCRVIIKCFFFSGLSEYEFCVPLRIYKKGVQEDLSPAEIDEIANEVDFWKGELYKAFDLGEKNRSDDTFVVDAKAKKSLGKLIDLISLQPSDQDKLFQSPLYQRLIRKKDRVLTLKSKLIENLKDHSTRHFSQKDLNHLESLISEGEKDLGRFTDLYSKNVEPFVRAYGL